MLTAFVLLLLSSCVCLGKGSGIRPSVVFFGSDWTDRPLVSRCAEGKVYWTLTERQNDRYDESRNTQWNNAVLPDGVTCHSNIASIGSTDNSTFAVFQSMDGQVFVNHISSTYKFGDWMKIGGNLPHDVGASIKGLDSTTVKDFAGKLYIFARSFTNSSHFYWSSLNKQSMVSSSWSMIGGGSAKLATDAAVEYNSFTKLLEAFMVCTDGYLYRSWQTSISKWSSWDKTGYFAPKTVHAPVVHEMDTNFFNGRINVFIHGNDGKLHHIWQTTCDKVPNVWGWCTWSSWNTIGNTMPNIIKGVTNTLTIGNNIHLGIEIFVVNSKGKLYKLWQTKRHGSWSDWQLVQGRGSYQISSLPAIVNDGTGWWSAFTLDASSNIMIVEQSRSFVVSPSSVKSGSIITAEWHMPIDEGSSSDWIGILPNGASNHLYVDYVYVGGSQNPKSEVIPSGKVSFTTFLPRGQYNVRYLVDKRYVAAVGSTLTITEGSSEEEWVQVFNGLFTGLNIKGVDVKTCVKDAKEIPKAFTEAFRYFEDRAIFTGMQMLGNALGDVAKAAADCKIEETFINRFEGFANDMAACISSGTNPKDLVDCAHFVIDFGTEILVLYENIYEIYGDIIGARNSFQINAFEQGGVNVGRVIAACLALPR